MSLINVEKSIRLALNTIFALELQTNIPDTDRLQLHTIRLWPLQDDPTEVCPFVTYGPHPQLGRVVIADEAEIGGPTWYWTYFRAVVGTPLAVTRDQAYDDVEELVTRVETVLQKYYALENVMQIGQLTGDDGSEMVAGNNPVDMMLGSAHRIYGGDAQFYGEGKLIWRYRIMRMRNW